MAHGLTTAAGSGALVLTQARPLDQNAAAVLLASCRTESTRRTYRAALDKIAGIVSGGQVDALGVDWSKLRFQHTAAIRAKLAEQGHAPSYVNKMLVPLRGVLRAAWRLGQMDAETYHRAVDIQGVRGQRLPAGRSLTPGEIAAMFQACTYDQTPAGFRDAAVLALLRSNLRRFEVANAKLSDYERETATLRVYGKGDKERSVPIDSGAAAALEDWLTIRGNAPGPLLLAINKGGRILSHGLSAQAVYNVNAKRAAQAGIENITPHDWRRSYVGDLLDQGADLSVVQGLVGHASPTTTARYDRRPEAAKRRAVDKLRTPYRRRTADR